MSQEQSDESSNSRGIEDLIFVAMELADLILESERTVEEATRTVQTPVWSTDSLKSKESLGIRDINNLSEKELSEDKISNISDQESNE